jgi:hypothetical protein
MRKNTSGFIHILLILLAVIAIGAVLFLGKDKLKSIVSVGTPVPSATADPTANWKIYTGEKFSFKYPSNLNIYVSAHGGSPNVVIPLVAITDLYNPENEPSDFTAAGHTIINFTYIQGIMPISFPYTNGSSSNNTVQPYTTNGISGIRGQETSTVGLVDTVYLQNSNEYVVIQKEAGEADVFDEVLSTFKFNDTDAQTTETAIKTLVNNFYTSLTNHDGKTLFSLMTPPTTPDEQENYNWLTGADLGTIPEYRVFLRSNISNSQINNILKEVDTSNYQVAITDQDPSYSNAGSTAGTWTPRTRNTIVMTVTNVNGIWLVDKFTDTANTNFTGNAGTSKYNGFEQ